MNHQPFEDWIFEEELTPEQQLELKTHLAGCDECRSLQIALKGVTRIMENPVELEPGSNFSQKWQTYAEKRKDREENLAAWVVLGALVLVFGAIVYANYGAIWFANVNIVQLLVTDFVNLIGVSSRLYQTIMTARVVLDVIPSQIIALVAVAGGLLASFWIVVWLATIRRIVSIQRRIE
jgi:hypothetical protein